MSDLDLLNCAYKGRCGGCSRADLGFAAHQVAKLAPILEAHPQAEVRYAPRNRVRDRADLVWENVQGEMRLGLYARESDENRAAGEWRREVVDLEACPMMSESLELWLKEFRLKAPPIQKGSVRLRVSPSGERGVWLDFSNSDVKHLFEEREYLQWLSARAFVEIGQRAKALTWKDGAPKLVDPILRPWFETYGPNGQVIPLFGPVSGFSQTGFAVNRALVDVVSELAEASGTREWLELFCGNGNFALALAARGHRVEAVEIESLALAGLERSRQEAGLEIAISRTDVYLKTKSLPPLAGRGLLIDPPRAGMRELLTQLASGDEKPSSLLYVSCFSEVFLRDAGKLAGLGFELKQLLGVDQFPFTPHSEWVGLFERK